MVKESLPRFTTEFQAIIQVRTVVKINSTRNSVPRHLARVVESIFFQSEIRKLSNAKSKMAAHMRGTLGRENQIKKPLKLQVHIVEDHNDVRHTTLATE